MARASAGESSAGRRQCGAPSEALPGGRARRGAPLAGSGAGVRRGAGEALADVERGRDDEDGDERRREHAAEHRRAEDLPRGGAGAGREDQRHHAEDERERGHEDRPQAQARAGERRVEQRRPALVLGLRELDDEDGVLGGEADDHHEADLREHVGSRAGGATARRTRRTRRSGVPRSTPNGRDQLSYCAARIRKTTSSERPKMARRPGRPAPPPLLERHAASSRSPSRAASSGRRPPRAPACPAACCSRGRASALIAAARYSLKRTV